MNTDSASTVNGIALEVGNLVKVNPSTGYLQAATTADNEFVWQVGKVYTMPDGQPGVKIQRIK